LIFKRYRSKIVSLFSKYFENNETNILYLIFPLNGLKTAHLCPKQLAMNISTTTALARLQASGQEFTELFQHHSLSVELYQPQGADLQQPHERDEVYVVLRGHGKFECGDRVTEFGPGDFLFVPAFTAHRFTEFSTDFATWVFFYGPLGGEAPLPLRIEAWRPEFREAFFQLNKAWIEVDYALEPVDLAVLSDPEKYIIEPGGIILSALAGPYVLGVVALRPYAPDAPELTKMAVDERWRGKKIGKRLMEAALAVAQQQGYRRVVLFSNTRTSAKAVLLYRQMGFVEIPLEPGVYQRADIKMEYVF
jgi:mannose-6-phosphate isomerase-like protein (cupin superfamily)/GNAT superfamily N-acetyltransferase